MLSFAALWLPTLLSAVAVFLVSFVLHTVLPWHRGDYRALEQQDQVMDVLRGFGIPAGDYIVPRPASREELKSPEFQERVKRGPALVMTVWNAGPMSMAGPLLGWFVYLVLVAGIAGHLTALAVHEHPEHATVFHTVILSSFLGYSAALWQMTIWYRRSWVTTLKSTIDGAVYAVITALIFGWLWKV